MAPDSSLPSSPVNPRHSVPAAAIEATFELLKLITSVLKQEPVRVHLPARQDRRQQLRELDSLVQRNAADPNAVVLTSLSDCEIVCWPARKWEVRIGQDGTRTTKVAGVVFPGGSLASSVSMSNSHS